jgi:hypothetical protein
LPALYRRGVSACLERDAAEVRRILMRLIGALNFEFEAPASRLFEIYDICLGHVAQGRFEVPRRVLERLGRASHEADPARRHDLPVSGAGESWHSG